jgi:hypothetical protein
MPQSIRFDDGPAFISRRLVLEAYFDGVKRDFSRPGKPADRAVIESVNGRLRDDCLNQHWFLSLDEAKRLTEAWREDYHRVRPHASLGQRTPFEFARRVDGHAHLPALSGEHSGWIRDGGRLNPSRPSAPGGGDFRASFRGTSKRSCAARLFAPATARVGRNRERTLPVYTRRLSEAAGSSMDQPNDTTPESNSADGLDRSSWPVWVGRVGDPQPKADYSALTPSERIALCWEATKQAWALTGRDLNESAFGRDSESLSRRRG